MFKTRPNQSAEGSLSNNQWGTSIISPELVTGSLRSTPRFVFHAFSRGRPSKYRRTIRDESETTSGYYVKKGKFREKLGSASIMRKCLAYSETGDVPSLGTQPGTVQCACMRENANSRMSSGDWPSRGVFRARSTHPRGVD